MPNGLSLFLPTLQWGKTMEIPLSIPSRCNTSSKIIVHKPVIICDKNKQRMTAISVADFMLNLLRTKCLFRSVEFNVSILFLALILSLFQNGSDAEKPPCSLSPNNLNNSFANLLKSVTFVTSNKTAYVNETVVFRIDINLNENDTTVIPVAYVDRNYEKSSCVLHEEGTVQSRICTFYNVQLSDNGKEIHFYLLAPVLDVQICYEPPSFLHVKGPPPPVTILLAVDLCNGVIIDITNLKPDTDLLCRLYTKNDHELLYEDHCTSSAIIIPGEMLKHRPGTYIVEILPSNPSGTGKPTYKTFSLNSSSIRVNISQIITRADDKNQFFAEIKIKVDCILTIPEYLHISSNCSDNHTYVLDISNISADSFVFLSHPLIKQRKYCAFHIRDSGGNTANVYTNQSTFHNENYEYSVIRGKYVRVTCHLIQGSTADGCIIGMSANNVAFYKIKRDIDKASVASLELGPFTLGTYTFSIYDLMKDGCHNDSLAIFTFFITFETTPSNTTSTPVIITTATPMNCNSDTTSSTQHALAAVIAILGLCCLLCFCCGTFLTIFTIKICKKRQNNFKSDDHCFPLEITSEFTTSYTRHDSTEEDLNKRKEDKRQDSSHKDNNYHADPVAASQLDTAKTELTIENTLSPAVTQQTSTVSDSTNHEQRLKDETKEETTHPSQTSTVSDFPNHEQRPKDGAKDETTHQSEKPITNQLSQSNTSCQEKPLPSPNPTLGTSGSSSDKHGQVISAKLELPEESRAVASIPPPRRQSCSTAEDSESGITPTSSLNLAQNPSLRKVYKDQTLQDAFSPDSSIHESNQPSSGQEDYVPSSQFDNSCISTLTTTDSETAPFIGQNSKAS